MQFAVHSGRARVVAETERGEELTVGTLTRGNHFGEQGLLGDAHRQYTVRAAKDDDYRIHFDPGQIFPGILQIVKRLE